MRVFNRAMEAEADAGVLKESADHRHCRTLDFLARHGNRFD